MRTFIERQRDRFRLQFVEARLESQGLDLAIAERRAEAADGAAPELTGSGVGS